MTRLTVHPPFPACAALVVVAALALPATAQIQPAALAASWVGAAAPAKVTSLRPGNLITQPSNSHLNGLTRDLKIAATNWTATVAIGTAGRCGSDDDGTTRTWVRNPDKVTLLNPEGWEAQRSGTPRPLVRYHIADDRYSRGEPIARACTYWEEGRWKPATGGTFTLRIWGKLCHAGISNVQRCWDLSTPTPPRGLLAVARLSGYGATFAPGSPNCGPERWPSPEWQADGGPPYAEWCDVEVSEPK